MLCDTYRGSPCWCPCVARWQVLKCPTAYQRWPRPNNLCLCFAAAQAGPPARDMAIAGRPSVYVLLCRRPCTGRDGQPEIRPSLLLAASLHVPVALGSSHMQATAELLRTECASAPLYVHGRSPVATCMRERRDSSQASIATTASPNFHGRANAGSQDTSKNVTYL